MDTSTKMSLTGGFLKFLGETVAELKRQDLTTIDVDLLNLKRSHLAEKLRDFNAELAVVVKREKGRAEQDLIFRGLASTTLRPSVLRGIENDANSEVDKATREYNRAIEEIALLERRLSGLPNPSLSMLPLTPSSREPAEILESLARFRNDYPDPTKVGFIMMRFGSTTAHTGIVEGICETLCPLGFAAVRADDKHYHDDLWPNVLTYIHGCGFGIAVFERLEQDEFNPNVSLEVGYLYGQGKPVCLLKDKTLETLQTDLVGKLYRPFDPQDPRSSIPIELSKWLADKGIVK